MPRRSGLLGSCVSLAFIVLAGCGGSGAATPANDAADSGALDGGEEAGVAAIEWEPCPMITGGAGTDALCATVPLPLNPDAPDGEKIGVFVKRIPAKETARSALWLLNGGPGLSGVTLDPLGKLAHEELPAVDVYMPDHRGTGRSSRLGCKTSESLGSASGVGVAANEWKRCAADAKAEWGDRLLAFSTTNAAKDVAVLIDRTRVPGQSVFVHGGSYGSYWAQRYLQVRPNGVDGVILEGVVPPGFRFTSYDQTFDAAGRLLANACAADAFCSGKMGADPWARIGATLAKLDAGHCPALSAKAPARVLLRLAAGNAVWDPLLRPLVLALSYRADRCNEADVKALTFHFDKLFFKAPPPELIVNSPVLMSLIAMSEFWPNPGPPVSELQAIAAAAYVSRDLGPYFGAAAPYFPRYEDPLIGKYPTTSVPMLMMNGTLDPATPLENVIPFAERFKAPNQELVVFPGATHSVLGSSPTKDAVPKSCGAMVVTSFLADPKKPVDKTCIANMRPVDFTIPSDVSKEFLGVADAWEE